NHPYRPLADFGRKLVRRLARHGSTFSGVGASDKPGAVQGIMLQLFFGDDEHTAAEGTYIRIMKTRKWLYLSSSVLLIISLGLYDENAAASVVKVVKLPARKLATALVFGTTYLLIQYGFLIAQLVATYDILLRDRFIFRRADELVSAKERLDNARAQFEAIGPPIDIHDETPVGDFEERMSARLKVADDIIEAATLQKEKLIRDNAPAEDVQLAAGEEYARTMERNSILSLLRKGRDLRFQHMDSSYNRIIYSAKRLLIESENDFANIRSEIPSERTGYKIR
ncbi:hypothetical protein U1737_15775, partial [Sphingomonas sp. LB3N6]|uniref:hypothetical protein n=1 Tax=Sphingomonas fucosidasi TaxID=3096164 RepID=UPI002FC8AC51